MECLDDHSLDSTWNAMRKIAKSKMRLDQFLLEFCHINTLKESRALIMAGKVLVNEQRVDKAGFLIDGHSDRIKLKKPQAYVSRGGEKLQHAIEVFGLANDIQGKVAVDIGASTGGFTHCLLQHTIAKVFAIDVGNHLLHWKLRHDKRVIINERCHIRDFQSPDERVDLIVADISFNSISQLAPFIFRKEWLITGRFLILIKPQFELPRNKVPHGGVILDQSLHDSAIEKVKNQLAQYGLEKAFIESKPKGRYGNTEFFLYAYRK